MKSEAKIDYFDAEFRKFTETALVILLAPIYWTFIIISTVTFLLPCWALRFLVIKLCQHFHPDWTPVSLRDNMLGEDSITTKPNAVIAVMITVQNPPPLEEFKQKYYDQLFGVKNPTTGEYLFPKYLQYHENWFGHNFWKWDPEFSMDNHVCILEGTENNEYTTSDQLKELLGPIVNKGFQPKHPYWEIHVIENFVPTDEDSSSSHRKNAYLFRFHHGIADGYSLLKCNLIHIFNQNLDNIVQPKFESNKSNLLLRAWNGFYTLASMPHCLVRQNLIDIDNNVWTKSERQLTRNLCTSRSNRILIENVKEIRQKFKISFNAVIYAAMAGGIRKYLREKCRNDHEIEIPEFMRSFAPFPWKNHPNEQLVNHWTCAVVPILTGISSPIERLLKMEEELNAIKSSPSPLANYLGIPLASIPPSPFIQILGKNLFCTAIVSIFPGPKDVVKLFGKYEVVDYSFWAPTLRGSAGIGIGLCSYNDAFRFCLSVDKAILAETKDLDMILNFMEEEVNLLLDYSSQDLQESVGGKDEILMNNAGSNNNEDRAGLPIKNNNYISNGHYDLHQRKRANCLDLENEVSLLEEQKIEKKD